MTVILVMYPGCTMYSQSVCYCIHFLPTCLQLFLTLELAYADVLIRLRVSSSGQNTLSKKPCITWQAITCNLPWKLMSFLY